MIVAMLAYLAWIILMVAMLGFVFHILHFDQPRPVKIPVRKDERE